MGARIHDIFSKKEATCSAVEGEEKEYDVRTRLQMVGTYSKSAPEFKSKDGAEGIRRWIAATEDFCKGVGMPKSMLMENVILKFEITEHAKIRAKLAKCKTWPAFVAELLVMYSDELQQFKLEQALLSVTRGPNEKMALLLQRIFSMSAEAYPGETAAEEATSEKTMVLRFLGALADDHTMRHRFNRLRLNKKEWSLQQIANHLDNEDALQDQEDRAADLRTGSVAPILIAARAGGPVAMARYQEQVGGQQQPQPRYQQQQPPQQQYQPHQSRQLPVSTSNQEPVGPQAPTRCTNCTQFGHSARSCMNPTLCFNCNGTGHHSNACPKPNRRPTGPSGSNSEPLRVHAVMEEEQQPIPEGEPALTVATPTTNPGVEPQMAGIIDTDGLDVLEVLEGDVELDAAAVNVEVAAQEADPDVGTAPVVAAEEEDTTPTFFVMVQLGSSGKWVRALVDTGSDRTLVSDSVPHSLLSPYLMRLRAAGGHELRVKGKCNGTLWTCCKEGVMSKTTHSLIVVNDVAFGLLLGKDWIGNNVKYIDIQDHCLIMKSGASVPMIQGEPTEKVQRSLAVRVMRPVQGITGLGFTIDSGARQKHFLYVKRDDAEVDAGGIPSMIVVLPSHIQSKVTCEVEWTSARELLLTTTNNSGIPWSVEPGTVVAVEEPSEVNHWNGFSFSLFGALKVPAGKGRGVTAMCRSSRPIHKSMVLNLKQVWIEGAEGTYQVFHTGSHGKTVQQVLVVNGTDNELELPPGVPLMVHVDKWNDAEEVETAEEAK